MSYLVSADVSEGLSANTINATFRASEFIVQSESGVTGKENLEHRLGKKGFEYLTLQFFIQIFYFTKYFLCLI